METRCRSSRCTGCRGSSFLRYASPASGTRRRLASRPLHSRRCLHSCCHRLQTLMNTCNSYRLALHSAQFECASTASAGCVGWVQGLVWHSPRIGRCRATAAMKDPPCASSSCSQYFAMKVLLRLVSEIFLKARSHPLLN